MAILFICPTRDSAPWVQALRKIDRELEVRVWPDYGDPQEVDFVVVWAHPHRALAEFKNLKCISSLGAGVDFMLSDPALPGSVPITRIVDEQLIRSMSEYLLFAVLYFFRKMERYSEYRTAKKWCQEENLRAGDVVIGIMGLGQLGRDAAQKLTSLGFNVRGWSRTPKDIAGVEVFYGRDQFDTFLSCAEILICLLPLTSTTRDILNESTFNKLPSGAYVINVARGEHLVEEDLLRGIGSGQLSGACLDVFREEPLPKEHPFWDNPKIFLTPHISSVSDPESIAPQIVENYKRAQSGRPLMNLVNRGRGY